MIVRGKVSGFVVAAVVLVVNLFLLLDKGFSFLGFLLVLLLIVVGANAAFSLIDGEQSN
ncbi:MAG: hypothetical protein ABSA75_11155 [Candidatus Bathyarchaeia archaeon]|jgi:hypothetical protein